MNPQSQHAQEDRLLEFVYGELPPHEARVVESHLEGCTRCSELLAGIRGVRATMKQLHAEPAPDAGLESLLAYAQQAARNAAAGPSPKPTLWRRWLVPVFGVAAVCAFGIISIEVSKTVDLSPQLSAKSESAPQAPPPAYASKDERPPAPSPAPTAAPVPQAPDMNVAMKEQEAPRKKMSKPAAMMPKADWSNAGSAGGAGLARADDAEADQYEEKKSADKVARSYEYNQRDAMTQAGPLTKAKPTRLSNAPEPVSAPGAAVPTTEAVPEAVVEEGRVAQLQQKQDAPAQGSLRLGGAQATGSALPNKTAKSPADSSAGDDFDDLLSAKSSMARREQQAAAPPPPPAAAAPRPTMPSVSTAAPSKRGEAKGKAVELSPSELTKLAEAARRSGDRAREAQYLTQALEAGATGSERLGLLNRLCDAEFFLGRRQSAVEACNLVLEEGPRSGAAQVARKRLSSEVGSQAADRAAPAEQAAPASSAPTQAQ